MGCTATWPVPSRRICLVPVGGLWEQDYPEDPDLNLLPGLGCRDRPDAAQPGHARRHRPVDIHVAFWRVPSLFEHSERFARDILT